MPITEHQGRPNDIPETVSDLLQGFALLSRLAGRNMPPEEAFTLQVLVQRLRARAERCGWEESTDLLREADDVLNRAIEPKR